jgi:hypothetical protein
MRRKPLVLASLAVAVLGSMLLIGAYAQEGPCFPESITVPGGQSRAALEQSGGFGLWTFIVTSVKGNISRVDIQIYESALPTSEMPKVPGLRISVSGLSHATRSKARTEA